MSVWNVFFFNLKLKCFKTVEIMFLKTSHGNLFVYESIKEKKKISLYASVKNF